MKRAKGVSHFKYYYDELCFRHWVTANKKGEAKSKEFLFRIALLDIVLFLIIVLFVGFRKSVVVNCITSGSNTIYCIYLAMLIYAAVAIASYAIYNLISFVYERKNGHLLLKKDIKGGYSIPFFIFKLIHLPWILWTCLVEVVLKWARIQDLKSYLPMLTCGYMYALLFGISILSMLCRIMNVIIDKYPILTNDVITDTTYLYLSVLITIIISKHIPCLLLMIAIRPFENKNSPSYKRVFYQYHLLNYYFYVAVTLILKSLNFSDASNILVEALFYSTNALALFSTVRKKVQDVR